jgi:hypothetical protein
MRGKKRGFVVVALLVGFSIAQFATPFAAFGQTSERRLEEALAEIALLKRVVAEQDKRIGELEKLVKMLQSIQQGKPGPVTGREENTQVGVQALATPWKSPSVWERVKNGMSQEQVVALLGRPTSVENAGSFRTLFYRGDVVGSGFVSGNIKLDDDRVWQVNKPVF